MLGTRGSTGVMINYLLCGHWMDCGTQKKTGCDPWSHTAAIGLCKTPQAEHELTPSHLLKPFQCPPPTSHNAFAAPGGVCIQAHLWTVTLAPTFPSREPSLPFQALVWHLYPPQSMLAWDSNWQFAGGSPLPSLSPPLLAPPQLLLGVGGKK